MNWEHLFSLEERAFYTSFLMEFCSLLLIGIYFLNPQKSKSTGFLVILAISSLTQVLLVQNNELRYGNAAYNKYLAQRLMYIYLVIEIFCCLLYVRTYTRLFIPKWLMLGSAIVYSIYAIAYWSLHFMVKYLPFHIEITEGGIIILFCLYFFIELFTQRTDKPLLQEPSFWAISGMLFLFSALTPLFLLFEYLRENYKAFSYRIYAINNVAYSILFITFTITILLNRKKNEPSFHYPNYYPS